MAPIQALLQRARTAFDEAESVEALDIRHSTLSVEDLQQQLTSLQRAIQDRKLHLGQQVGSSHYSDGIADGKQATARAASGTTPGQLEEWTNVFNHFDRDASQSLDINEFAGAMAALGVLLEDEEVQQTFDKLAGVEDAIDLAGYLAFLVSRRAVFRDDGAYVVIAERRCARPCTSSSPSGLCGIGRRSKPSDAASSLPPPTDRRRTPSVATLCSWPGYQR